MNMTAEPRWFRFLIRELLRWKARETLVPGVPPWAGPHVSCSSRRRNPHPRGFQKTKELSRHEARVYFSPPMAAILLCRVSLGSIVSSQCLSLWDAMSSAWTHTCIWPSMDISPNISHSSPNSHSQSRISYVPCPSMFPFQLSHFSERFRPLDAIHRLGHPRSFSAFHPW